MQHAFSLVFIAALGLAAPAPVAAQSGSAADAKVVSEATKGTLKSTKGKYFDKSFNASVEYEAQVIDLNGDGQPEVFTKHHGAMFGGAGMAVDLLIKDKSGKWQSQFGFPGDYNILKTKNKGYPDIEVTGPGTCFPIWRWNGKVYDIYKRCAR